MKPACPVFEKMDLGFQVSRFLASLAILAQVSLVFRVRKPEKKNFFAGFLMDWTRTAGVRKLFWTRDSGYPQLRIYPYPSEIGSQQYYESVIYISNMFSQRDLK